MLVKSRRVRQQRLRPQAGCQIQPSYLTPVNAAATIRLHHRGGPACVSQLRLCPVRGEFWCGGGPVRLHVAGFVRALIETEWRVLVAH
jgi:hypothetical protein